MVGIKETTGAKAIAGDKGNVTSRAEVCLLIDACTHPLMTVCVQAGDGATARTIRAIIRDKDNLLLPLRPLHLLHHPRLRLSRVAPATTGNPGKEEIILERC
jgi:hypothetical protein